MQGTVEDLKRAFHKAKPQFYPARQRFTFPLKAGEKKPTALAAGKKLSDYDLNDGTVLIFKDLGPQVLIGHLIARENVHHWLTTCTAAAVAVRPAGGTRIYTSVEGHHSEFTLQLLTTHWGV